MNRFNIGLPIRLAKLGAWLAIVGMAAVALSGCGAGQVSQTAMQEPAVNGNKVTINNLALRDIRMQGAQQGDFIQPGRTVDLVMVVVNQSPNVEDRLTSVTTDIGTVTISGDARVPASGMLFVGTPGGQNAAPGPPQSSGAARATITLSKPISNGLTYNFTFNFEKAGQGNVLVPISSGQGPAPEPVSHH
ncbi:putative lipoprotein LpqE [Mycobacterium kubicae]|uniref:Lipoprotein LpqE n=1 Tax=Mycobacterium kubicae TaxID=120959 RepID=A0AAX1J8U9_9MYCO|nr:hypothetical protein [Mycobacterium kubicae]MCV7098184.1 hypothetical protein [Mycobacterium kubicae]OBF24006.1 hypothetical protein A5725_08205 [Mycobacterium kubicae]OBK54683.1 hypothetical protein A5657_12560 [Mycobacterium kubicae]ORV98132.1 hypothetical protein AWC13_14070 [Mycobacterium kubicae]QNI14125.1 hypothetical protein GAN18_26355 [Mycobacterium kubicae]